MTEVGSCLRRTLYLPNLKTWIYSQFSSEDIGRIKQTRLLRTLLHNTISALVPLQVGCLASGAFCLHPGKKKEWFWIGVQFRVFYRKPQGPQTGLLSPQTSYKRGTLLQRIYAKLLQAEATWASSIH